MSFLDRNRVVYTSWTDLKEGVWQAVRLAVAEMKPNPYFQPPDAKQGRAIDVSDVGFIAFAPRRIKRPAAWRSADSLSRNSGAADGYGTATATRRMSTPRIVTPGADQPEAGGVARRA